MNESEILARFSEVRGEEVAESPIKTDALNDPDTISLFGFFNADETEKQDAKYLEKLSFIKEFAQDGAKDRADMLWNIKNLRGELGMPPFGKSDIDHLYEFVRLKAQAKALDKEIEAYK